MPCVVRLQTFVTKITAKYARSPKLARRLITQLIFRIGIRFVDDANYRFIVASGFIQVSQLINAGDPLRLRGGRKTDS